MKKRNLKSNILKIGVVVALICMLIPVIAAEDVDDSAVADAVNDDVVSEDITQDDDELSDDADEDLEEDDENLDEEYEEEIDELDDGADVALKGESADLEVTVISDVSKADVGDLVKFGIMVYNDGPDTAYNVIVANGFISGDVKILSGKVSQGVFNPKTGIWHVGDLAPGEFALMTMVGEVLSNEDICLITVATSDTPDPNLANNIVKLIIEVGGDAESGDEAASSDLPATGNPIVMMLLALLAIVGLSLKRKS